MKLTIYGAPRTKKNHGYVAVAGGRKFHMPSKAWQKWEKTAEVFYGGHRLGPHAWPYPIDSPVNCCAFFYRDRNTGDAVGYYQGLADLLQKRGIVANDKWIVSWDGSRLRKDKDNPRVEVELVPVEES